jgi:hypothetical protein
MDAWAEPLPVIASSIRACSSGRLWARTVRRHRDGAGEGNSSESPSRVANTSARTLRRLDHRRATIAEPVTARIHANTQANGLSPRYRYTQRLVAKAAANASPKGSSSARARTPRARAA